MHVSLRYSNDVPCSDGGTKEVEHERKLRLQGTEWWITFLSEASSLFEKHLNTKTIYSIPWAHLFSHVEAKIVDQNGKILPDQCMATTKMKRLTKSPLEWIDIITPDERLFHFMSNKRLFMFCSRDLALMTEMGFCKIIGRIDDMVIRGGENLYPKEIEDMLSKHPNVLETYIELCAWIHLEEGAKEFDVKEYLKGKVRS
ncbi:Uncharacterized protein FKW44_012213 [Caligus rogercresseyi]|uniref:Uncharacterized protein n=1 Tax=Caligus rogercresseyi TaxID=217165 RepID=A0A7T8HKA6_CALRO|nr:Uncharacterized protein FKW44_012213 [Caligus rogercresseyi]